MWSVYRGFRLQSLGGKRERVSVGVRSMEGFGGGARIQDDDNFIGLLILDRLDSFPGNSLVGLGNLEPISVASSHSRCFVTKAYIPDGRREGKFVVHRGLGRAPPEALRVLWRSISSPS